MAIQKQDLFGHVQSRIFEGTNVRMIPSSQTLHISPQQDRDRWHVEAIQKKADALFATYESAVIARRDRKATKVMARWLHQVHLDRVAYLREIAQERGLRLDPIGRGPVVDRPSVHYRDRLPWYLTPIDRYADRRLPDRASEVVETWNGAGTSFDGLFIADEPVSSGRFPVHDLIGAVSADGRVGDWFVLDRWAS